MSTALTWLLDGNVLSALAIANHAHHPFALAWFDAQNSPFATCAITQGTLLRLHLQYSPRPDAATAWSTLRQICAHPDHVFWDDAFSYLEIDPVGLIGHRQVTDAYLAQLARRRGGRVATLDSAFAQAHPDVATLI